MAQLPLDEAVDRFQANEDRVDKWVNGQSGYVSSTGAPVESIPAFLERVEEEIDQTTGAVASNLQAAEAAKNAAEAARDAAIIGSGVYVDEPTGRAAVADGVAFKVQGSGMVAAYEYRRVNASSSTLIAIYPSQQYIQDLVAQTLGPSQHYAGTQLYRDEVTTDFGILDKNFRLVWKVTEDAGIQVGGGFEGDNVRITGSVAGHRDGYSKNALMHGVPDSSGRVRAVVWEDGDGRVSLLPGRELLEQLTSLAGYRDGFNLTPLFVGPEEADGTRKALMWVNREGEMDFLPSPELLARIQNPSEGIWRGSVPTIGPVRIINTRFYAAVQDGDGRVYDAAQRGDSALDTFVVSSSSALELLTVQGQSNAGAPVSYLSGSYGQLPYPGHTVQMYPAANASGYEYQPPTDLTDLVPAEDSNPANNYVSTLVGHAVEGLGYRVPFKPSPGVLTQTTWSGGQPISHFQKNAPGSYWWGNAIQARQKAKELALKYGRNIQEKWMVWIQGEGGEHGRTAYANALNTFINTFRPEARDALGQVSLAKFGIVQTNVGDWPDAEPATSNMESTNLAQWDVGRTRYADGVRLIGPMYQCPIILNPSDNIHTSLLGRLMLAEMVADAYVQENVKGQGWKPLWPISAVRSGVNIDLTFEVPEGTLSWDTDWVAPMTNKGFAFVDSNGAQTIQSVTITSNTTVRITLAATPTGGSPVIQYALGAVRDSVSDGWAAGRGQLMSVTNRPSFFYRAGYAVPSNIRHYCVKFQLEVTS